MRVQVNLATRPFVELRPFFLRLRLIMAGLAVLGLAFAITAHVLSAKAEKQQAELDRLRDQTIAAQSAKLHTEQRMRQPANAAVLDRAHFLNALFLRKSFSWTAVMMDLENVLPTGVQVTSIEPAVSTDGEVIIRLRVAGERDRAVQLVRNLERSRRLLQPRLGSEAPQTKEAGLGNGGRPPQNLPGTPGISAAPPGVEFEILATYNPLPAGQPYAVGHGRPANAVEPFRPSAALRPASIPGLPASANTRNGYPANGVVLPPYVPAGRRPAPPLAGQSSGGPR